MPGGSEWELAGARESWSIVRQERPNEAGTVTGLVALKSDEWNVCFELSAIW